MSHNTAYITFFDGFDTVTTERQFETDEDCCFFITNFYHYHRLNTIGFHNKRSLLMEESEQTCAIVYIDEKMTYLISNLF